jgi:N-acetylneuraminic acid mutarotase
MQSKSVSDLVRPRTFSIVLACAVTGLITSGALLAILRSEAATKVSQRTLTFAERVTYQRAIEDVYWRHRIWPKENLNPKPSLDAVMSHAQLENKVAGYLRDALVLEGYWRRPITAEDLQTEMDRMAENTKQPDVLRELFDALGNDPFVIAECLARPVLSERLITNRHAYAPRIHGEQRQRADADLRTRKALVATNANYRLPTIPEGAGCTDDTWTTTSTINAPDARDSHTAVWTGSEMIVWGGFDGSNSLNTGGRYNPTTDSWTATSTINAPDARDSHIAVWSGSEMIVWGGNILPGEDLNTGGRYNPATDSWVATSITNAPLGRHLHTAVWTGSEMIVWGGFNGISFLPTQGFLNTGGRYNPSIDSWVAISTTNAPAARAAHTAVWNGSEMIVWGGIVLGDFDDTGARYNPATDTWIATSTSSAPDGRFYHTAVWTSSEMIVWGGTNNISYFNTGGRYDPSTDSWTATTTVNAPDGRWLHTAVWSSSEMIVWGGTTDQISYFNTGGRYDPSTDSWTATTTINAPDARASHTAVWSSSEMIVWGGFDGNNSLNTGGRYCAQSGATPTPTPTATATSTATATPTATATATPTATSTPTPTPTPCTGRCTPTPRPRPTPAPRP